MFHEFNYFQGFSKREKPEQYVFKPCCHLNPIVERKKKPENRFHIKIKIFSTIVCWPKSTRQPFHFQFLPGAEKTRAQVKGLIKVLWSNLQFSSLWPAQPPISPLSATSVDYCSNLPSFSFILPCE